MTNTKAIVFAHKGPWDVFAGNATEAAKTTLPVGTSYRSAFAWAKKESRAHTVVDLFLVTPEGRASRACVIWADGKRQR